MKKTLITLAALAMASVASAEWITEPTVVATGPLRPSGYTFEFMLRPDLVDALKNTDVGTNIAIAGYGDWDTAAGNNQTATVISLARTETEGLYTITVGTTMSISWTDPDSIPTGFSYMGGDNYGYANKVSTQVTLTLWQVYGVEGVVTDGTDNDAATGQDAYAVTTSITSWEGMNQTIGTYNAKANGDAKDFSVRFNKLAAVPEPATATLSLLALAGLAARRRRK